MRIFVEPDELRAGEIAIRGDEHHYVGRVRRARAGDAIELVDGAGRCAAGHIVRIADGETIVRVAEVVDASEPPPRVRALIPWIKGDRMDDCVEKLVEVGCDELVVWPAARAVVQLAPGARRDARIGKLRATAVAAARQCRRATVPDVRAADSLAAALAALPAAGVRLALDPTAAARLATAVGAPAALAAPAHVALCSGPEGGLTPDELAQLAAAGFTGVTLGPRTLRAETAPVIAVALVRAATST
jgi:16S rRNA (uracil1498-N3)-methyltransferase